LTGESAEFLDGELVTRVGQTFMNDVEVHGFGGMDTSEAAINFVGAKSYPSHVINCVVHNSLGW
jgi:hypothetical protein